jgi:hypothetical protein
MPEINLTIAIPSLPDRWRKNTEKLIAKLQVQIGSRKDVQILSIIDNRTMSIGAKRTKLFGASTGKYTCIIDDDDDIVDDFVQTLSTDLLSGLDVDVICYEQLAKINGRTWTVKTSLDYNKEHPFDQMQVDQHNNPVPCCRPPWHWCAWRTDFVKTIPFGDSNCHEDAYFVKTACKLANTQHVIDKVMCLYNESQTPFTSAFGVNDIKPVKI